MKIETYSVWESIHTNPLRRRKVEVQGTREGYVQFSECGQSDKSMTEVEFRYTFVPRGQQAEAQSVPDPDISA